MERIEKDKKEQVGKVSGMRNVEKKREMRRELGNGGEKRNGER